MNIIEIHSQDTIFIYYIKMNSGETEIRVWNVPLYLQDHYNVLVDAGGVL